MSQSVTTHVAAGAPGGCQADLLSGFLVFLIALPLCLGIAAASNYPPICGVWTAVLGGIICTFLSNSQMTIKGPAAGMIVIVAGSVLGFKADLMAGGMSEAEAMSAAYRMSLGVGVVAGIIQIIFGVLRAGVLADLFPISAVHGLLASIGITIIFKQAYTMIGGKAPDGEPIEAIMHFPSAIPHAVADIAWIGVPSLIILFTVVMIRIKPIKKIPGPVFVLLFAVPLGLILNIDEKFLVKIPDVLGLSKPRQPAFFFPDFSGIGTSTGIRYIILFCLIGSLESLLSAKAIDLLDPQKRKTNLNRDLLAVGVANTVAAAIGALPMISEIVRSSANINNGAKTKFANFFHGCFLLVSVLLLGFAIAKIPNAALAAMLVFAGYRLAHPREFLKAWKIGPEQLLIFVTTIVVVLFTDLLIGIAAGLVMKLMILLFNRISPVSWFRCVTTVENRKDSVDIIAVRGPILFTNLLRLKARIAKLEATHVIVDASNTTIIDHTSMEKLHELEMDFRQSGRELTIDGLEAHSPFSKHPFAGRKKAMAATT